MPDNEVDFSIQAIDKSTAILQKIESGVSSFGNKIQGLAAKAKASIGSFTELNNAWMIAQQVIRYAEQAYEAIIVNFLEYADVVRTLRDVTGQSAEEISRIVQVTDDYKISTQELEVAQRKLATQGKSLSTDTLAKMSDEYLKLNTGAERQTFLTNNLGRAGQNWAEIMKAGSAAIKQRSAEVDKSLILGDEQLKQARDLEIAQDNLQDSFQATKIQIATQMIPGIQALTDAVNILIQVDKLMAEDGKAQLTATKEQIIAAVEYVEAQKIKAETDREAAVAAQELSDVYQTELNLTQSIFDENQKYIQSQNDINDKMAETTVELEAAKKKYGENSAQVKELQDKLAALADEYAQNAEDHTAATNKIVYNNILQKLSVDGLTDAEFAMAQQMGVALGMFDQASADYAIALNTLTTMLADGRVSMEDYTLAVQNGADAVQELVNKINGVQSKEVYIKVHTLYDSGGMGSSGGASAPRIAQMRAAGGPVEQNTPYIVGEKGPELYVPNKSGTIIPNGGTYASNSGISKMDMQEAVQNAMSPIMNQLINSISVQFADVLERKMPR